MGTYTQFKDGYKKEASFGATNTIDAATQTYLWGAMNQRMRHPSPITTVNYRPTGVNAKEVPAATDAWKARFDSRGMYGMWAQNGVVLWAALGKSTTAGGGPYTHTITPTTDGTLLPSFCFQHERTGSATDWSTQFLGCKVNDLTLSHDMKQAPFLMAKIGWLAQKATKVAFTLTNDPVLPPTANDQPFVNLTRTWDYGGTPLSIDGLVTLEISIENGLFALFSDSWDTGVYTGQWPKAMVEAFRKQYHVRFTYHPSTIETALWDELVASENTKDALFKWTRSATDYIQVLCSDCKVIEHSLEEPEGKDEEELDSVTLEPRALTVTVVDSIAGGYYGE